MILFTLEDGLHNDSDAHVNGFVRRCNPERRGVFLRPVFYTAQTASLQRDAQHFPESAS